MRFHSLAVYMDDICCFSKDWDSHIEQLKLTLSMLQDAWLSCSQRKTEIGFPEIEYLGYRVSGDSIRISNKQIEVIKKLLPQECQSTAENTGDDELLEETCSPFSKNTFNMCKLLRKDVLFEWTAECDAELE